MKLGPGLFELAKRQEAAKHELKAMRERIAVMVESSDPDKATLASAIIHLADCIDHNMAAIKEIQDLLTRGRSPAGG